MIRMEDFKIKGIKHKTLKDTIYSTLKDIILNGGFPSDDYINEQSLATQLNVSRTPLREAMYDLINEDLIEFRPRKGYRLKQHSNEEVKQIFLLRAIIEKGIKDPLFENVGSHDVQKLKNIIDDQKQAMEENNSYHFMQLDKEFHRNMFMIAKYNIFLKSYDVFHNLTILIGSKAITKQGRMKDVIQEHLDIVETIETNNKASFEEKIDKHLSMTLEALGSIDYLS